MQEQLRIARPVSALERAVAMYRDGLGLREIGRFEDHEGFDGVMLGREGLPYHFEFTYCRAHPVLPNPTAEDLLVFYLPDAGEWRQACVSMLEAGFVEVAPFNPYWGQRGRTFEDPDRYRVVLERARWEPSARPHAVHSHPIQGNSP
jgi:catechol 2,3-dioxygenase-like lactoylglutathione lyase family enzyme